MQRFVAPFKEGNWAQSRIRANPETCFVQGGPGDTIGWIIENDLTVDRDM